MRNADPTDEQLAAAAAGWRHRAACRDQLDYCDGDPDIIAATCRLCPVAVECAKLGRLELARALAVSDRGHGRVYAGHQLSELAKHARRDRAGRLAAFRALQQALMRAAGSSVLGYNCRHCGQTTTHCTCTPIEESRHADN